MSRLLFPSKTPTLLKFEAIDDGENFKKDLEDGDVPMESRF
jgi:hypothetical protein